MNPLRRPRVLLVTDSLQSGGAERVAVDIANSLDPRRFEVQMCATRIDGPLHSNVDPGIPVSVLGRRATWDLPKLVEFSRLVRSTGFDVIHSHGRGTLKFVALAQMLRLIKVRHVFHDHYGWLHVDHDAGIGLRQALNQADVYVGVDESLCKWACSQGGVQPERVKLVRSGVNIDRFDRAATSDLRAQLGLPDDHLVLAMVANFHPQKDHSTLFRAMAGMPEDALSKLDVVAIGSTESDVTAFETAMTTLDHLELGDSVHIVGARSDVSGVLKCADAGVLSSVNETGPLAILEYMAAGLPFVATETGQIARAVRDLNVGFLTPPADHEALTGSLLSLIKMGEDGRRKMGERGRREAESQFSLTRTIEQIQDIYDDLLGESEI